MPRTGENIYHRKDGRWEGRYVKGRDNNKTCFGYVFGRTYRETKRKLALARCKWIQEAGRKIADKKTLAYIGRIWLQDSEPYLKLSTTAKYSEYLQRYIYPQLGGMPIAEIDNEAVAHFCRNLLETGGSNGQGLSPKTVQEIFRLLKQLRKYALRSNFSVGYAPDCMYIKQKAPITKTFTMSERKKLQAYLQGKQDNICLGILLCLLTGLRIGEICALTWDDISLEDKTVHVRKTLQRISWQGTEATAKTKIIVTAPKSDCSIREIPLPDMLCLRLQPLMRSGAYLLTGQKDRFIEPRTLQNRFKAVLRACGIAKANFHALRHTFATAWIEAGQDVKCLSVILGHASVDITLNRYVHPSMKLKRTGMEQMLLFKP